MYIYRVNQYSLVPSFLHSAAKVAPIVTYWLANLVKAIIINISRLFNGGGGELYHKQFLGILSNTSFVYDLPKSPKQGNSKKMELIELENATAITTQA